MGGYEAVKAALEAQDLMIKSWGSVHSARCPGPLHHRGDQRPSLSLREGEDGKALLYCHAGCDTSDVVDALDLEMTDLFRGGSTGAVVDTYEYLDENEHPLIRVLRKSPKGFSQERWEDGEWKPGLRDVRRVPYRLSRLISAVQGGTPIYLTEGEKDADNMAAAYDVVTTTFLGGANKWRQDYAPFFAGATVVICGDNDEPGRLSAGAMKRHLESVAKKVTIVYSAVGKDVSDHILAGLGLEALVPAGTGMDEFKPLDWEHYEVEDTEWLYEPYIPRKGRVLAFGPAGSLKSLWAMWVAAKLSQEGKRVAYFSLEMLPSQTAHRLKQLRPDKEHFEVYTYLRLGSELHTDTIIAGLKGCDLIVIDSWSAARSQVGTESNADIAALDNEVFLPIVNLTGAAILILDNTGKPVFTDQGKFKQDQARGASAKGDKMEVTLWFDRPWEDDNYSTRLTVKKMRLDYPMPKPMVIKTPRDRIEFYLIDSEGKMKDPVWKSDRILEGTPEGGEEGIPELKRPEPGETTPAERLALARVKDMFKATVIEEEEEEEGSA